jgi:hypothetical protein
MVGISARVRGLGWAGSRCRARMAGRITAAMRADTRPVSVIGGLLRDVTRTWEELIAENILLRQQLLVAARSVKQPKFAPHERGLVVLLARFVPTCEPAYREPDISTWHEPDIFILGSHPNFV